MGEGSEKEIEIGGNERVHAWGTAGSDHQKV